MRNRNLLIFFFVTGFTFLLTISACQTERDSSSLTPSVSPTTAPTSTATITQTPTKKPTRTPKPTKTVTLAPSATQDARDFDASTIKTITPAALQQCPATNPSIEFDVEKIIVFNEGDDFKFATDLEVDVLIEYLNQGVPIDSIINAINENEEIDNVLYQSYLSDVTGDGVNDFVFRYQSGAKIIGCENGQYKELGYLYYSSSMFGMDAPYLDVLDINNDGLNEIAIYFVGCGYGACSSFQIFAWNGSEMVDITGTGCNATYTSPFSFKYKDTNEDGLLDIVLIHEKLTNDIFNTSLFPDREEIQICMWNGSKYLPVEHTYTKPIYRVQAYQDANHQAEQGNLDNALALYQRVIHDETLLWFNPNINERARRTWYFFMEVAAEENPDIIYDPMYTDEGKRDIYEYPLLASASYYRMLLIYLDQGDIKNAETMLVILEDAYPPGAIGGYFTQMGEIIIENYKETGDLTLVCPEILAFHQENRAELDGILTYLQITIFSYSYYSESWCPYLSEGNGEQ